MPEWLVPGALVGLLLLGGGGAILSIIRGRNHSKTEQK